MGMAHVGDWPTGGERTLEYEVVLGSFEGDWYEPASGVSEALIFFRSQFR